MSCEPDPIAHWTARLAAEPPPVLAATARALAGWQAAPDRIDANALADVVLQDPLMTLRLLTVVTQRLGPRLSRPVETVTAGLVLLGIEPFLDAFAGVDALEDRLAGQDDALQGVQALVTRGHRSARLAAAFAVHRQDENAEVLHQAALLRTAGGLLLWAQAPQAARAIARRQAADPALRSEQAQREVLGVPLGVIEHALLAHWGLPPSLAEFMQPGLPASPGPRCVTLAVRIARHAGSAAGWDDPALPRDYADLGQLLQLSPPAAQALVREVAG